MQCRISESRLNAYLFTWFRAICGGWESAGAARWPTYWLCNAPILAELVGDYIHEQPPARMDQRFEVLAYGASLPISRRSLCLCRKVTKTHRKES
ncbi:hypothetical protein EVAR_81904_1 [Eumeta japonica]|uniref:Uncharacterized protein n=1 Tax=Eumeta variegata TaxID=151549 RepID=A0A4C1UX32_EUMVA|nr:hypothetical protein EVAR_81904_1 [Eumeta japonica]